MYYLNRAATSANALTAFDAHPRYSALLSVRSVGYLRADRQVGSGVGVLPRVHIHIGISLALTRPRHTSGRQSARVCLSFRVAGVKSI